VATCTDEVDILLIAIVVYIILEAHHRFEDDAVADIWSLIRRVYEFHPELTTAVHRPEIVSVARITVAAWQRRHAYIMCQQRNNVDLSGDYEPPQWISEVCRKFDFPLVNTAFAASSTTHEYPFDTGQLLLSDFDFDSIDWSFWHEVQRDAASYETNR
jgi:hypothetical protein